MSEEQVKKARPEQKWVVILADGRVIGTPNGGPLTRDGAWLTERWYTENKPELQARATKMQARAEDER